jgi:hypothetical protein
MRRSFWLASAALACVLAVAPVLFGQSGEAAQPGAPKIDLNTASQAELETLPGVDQSTAKQIIAGRPYTAVADLSKAGVIASTVEKITPLVKVGPAGKAAASTDKGAQKAASGVGKAADATAKGVGRGHGQSDTDRRAARAAEGWNGLGRHGHEALPQRG